MTDETKNDPARKMRVLLSGGKSTAISKLPKKDDPAAPFLPKQEGGNESLPSDTSQKTPRTKRKPALLPKSFKFKPNIKFKPNFGPAFWTTTGVLSLTINLILVIMLLVLVIELRRSGLRIASMTNIGTNLLGGLYSNFEKMDRANINTNVQVNSTIPVKFDLQVNQQTNIVLLQDVTIDNVVVTVKTGGLNITNALTTIVLPQGTTLPIVLNLSVPVDTTVPIVLNVPVNIPLDKTELHEPFTGLQAVIKPFYCLINKAAVNLDGNSICQ